jgi:hypothetical protein
MVALSLNGNSFGSHKYPLTVSGENCTLTVIQEKKVGVKYLSARSLLPDGRDGLGGIEMEPSFVQEQIHFSRCSARLEGVELTGRQATRRWNPSTLMMRRRRYFSDAVPP